MGAVISLHALANYLNNSTVLKLWDAQQFAVQIVVFCSAYLFFSRPPELTFKTFGAYFIKRFWRLYQPFLIYAIVFFATVLLLRPATFQWKTVFKALTLVGGIDISWLVLLFVQFIPTFVLIEFLFKKHRFWFYGYVFVTIYTAIFFFFLPFPYHWRWIMWLTWSFMGLYAMYFKHYENDENPRTVSYMLFATIFVVLICVNVLLREDLYIYPHKYPPDILILAYGIMWIGIFDFLYQHRVFEYLQLVRPLEFLSKNSYSLFFIHYWIIYVMNTAFSAHRVLPWWAYWIVLFAVTIPVQIGVNKGMEMIRKN